MRTLKRMAASATVLAALFSAAGATAQWSTSGNSAGASDFLGSTNAADVSIRTNNTERMRITSGGLVGLNPGATISRLLHLSKVSSSAPQLTLGETSTSYWQFEGGADFLITDPAGNPWIQFFPITGIEGFSLGPNFEVYNDVTGGGNFGFGTGLTSLVGRAMVAGHVVPATDNAYNVGTSTNRWETIYACNGTIQTSDAKFKENIHDMRYGIGDVMRLHPVSYAWTKEEGREGRQLGLLAQEIQPVIGEVVKGESGEDARLGVFYSDFVPVLIGAMQDQQNEIHERAEKNNELREQLKVRAERIAHMEAALEALR